MRVSILKGPWCIQGFLTLLLAAQAQSLNSSTSLTDVSRTTAIVNNSVPSTIILSLSNSVALNISSTISSSASIAAETASSEVSAAPVSSSVSEATTATSLESSVVESASTTGLALSTDATTMSSTVEPAPVLATSEIASVIKPAPSPPVATSEAAPAPSGDVLPSSEPAPPAPMETTVLPTGDLSAASTELYTVTSTQAPSAAVTGVMETVITAVRPNATTSSMVPIQTGKNYTIVINPAEGIKKLIPFIITAQPGSSVFLQLYGNTTSDGSHIVSIDPENLCVPLTGTGAFDTDQSLSRLTVNDSKPIFLGSANQTECLAGMVGIINPPKADYAHLTFADTIQSGGSSMSAALSAWAASNAGNAATLDSIQKSDGMKAEAWQWGYDYSLSGLQKWNLSTVVGNILYTRLTMALNPNLLALYGSTAAYQPPPDSNVPQPVTELSASLAAPSQQTSTTPSATSHYGGNAGVATALAGSTAKGSAPRNTASALILTAMPVMALFVLGM